MFPLYLCFLFPGTLTDSSFYNLNMEFGQKRIYYSYHHHHHMDVCSVYVNMNINAGSHVIASIKYTIYIWFSCSEEVEKWRKCVWVRTVHPCLTLNTIETLKIAQPKAKWSLKPFSVLFLFHMVVFLGRLFQFMLLLFMLLLLLLLVLLKLIPCLPYLLFTKTFLPDIQFTHMSVCMQRACVLCLFE